MNMFYSYRRIKGFTLVEVIIAMVILSMTVAGLLSVFLSAHRFVGRAKRRLFAVNYARSLAESLRNEVRQDKWDCNIDDAGCGGLGLTTNLLGDWTTPINFNEGGITYSRRYKVESVGTSDYRKVSIKVTWQEPQI